MKGIAAASCVLLLASMIAGCSSAEPVSQQREDAATAKDADAGETVQRFEWETSAPGEQGLDEAQLALVDEHVEDHHSSMLSLLIVRNGKLVHERYYNGTEQEQYTEVFSVSKSILSALAGIAIEQGHIRETDQPLSELAPQLFEPYDDARLREMTLHDALSMTAGLRTIDGNYPAWFSSPSFAANVLEQPIVAEHGEQFIYNTGISHLVSAAITEAVGIPTKDYAEQVLFGPLDITNYRWDRSPEGYYIGGTGIHLTPRDMAKFGYLYLQGGEWEGEQVVPRSWVEESTRRQTAPSIETNYGYYFWLGEAELSDGRKTPDYEANGYGGQHIRVIPELDTVIVVTRDAARGGMGEADELIQDYILPAVTP